MYCVSMILLVDSLYQGAVYVILDLPILLPLNDGNIQSIYKAVRPSVCHVDNSPGTAGFDSSGA